MLWFRFLTAAVLGLALASPAFADDEYDYGPACQWIRLHGETPRVPEAGPEASYLLTVTYRISGRKVPTTLLTNYPLPGGRFKFLLSGLNEKMDYAVLMMPEIYFAKRVEFTYQARTADGSWVSPWRKVYYSPIRIKTGSQVLCQGNLRLNFSDEKNDP